MRSQPTIIPAYDIAPFGPSETQGDVNCAVPIASPIIATESDHAGNLEGADTETDADLLAMPGAHDGQPPKIFGNLISPTSHSGYPLWLGAVHVTHISGPELTHLDRQIWTYLVARAYNRIGLDDEHRIPYVEIREQMNERMVLVAGEDGNKSVRRATSGGHESNDRIREAIAKLQKTIVAWDIFDEDERTSQSIKPLAKPGRPPKGVKRGDRQSQLLGSTGHDYGHGGERVLLYSFPVHLRSLLSNPTTFSYLRTRVVFSFTSQYALRLYETLQRYADRRIKPWLLRVDVDRLRLLIGIREGQLQGFGRLWQRALQPALEQINAFAEFEVACEVHRGNGRGSPVEGVTLTVRPKSEAAAVQTLYDAGPAARRNRRAVPDVADRQAEAAVGATAKTKRISRFKPRD